jgi:PAS domain S-box-containing protein
VAAQDVTERTRSAESQQNSASKYRVLFEESADAHWILDDNGIVECNSAALRMFGYPPGAVMPHPARMSPAKQPDGTPSKVSADEKIAAAFQNGKERFEWMHQRSNGDVFFFPPRCP